MSTAEQKLIDFIKGSGSFCLQGDREIYRYIEFINGKFYHRTGSTELNEDTQIYEAGEREVLRILIDYASIKAITWNKGEVKNAEDACRVIFSGL